MIKVSEERRRSGASSSSTEDSIVIRADPALDRWDIMHHHISLLLCGWMGPLWDSQWWCQRCYSTYYNLDARLKGEGLRRNSSGITSASTSIMRMRLSTDYESVYSKVAVNWSSLRRMWMESIWFKWLKKLPGWGGKEKVQGGDVQEC